MNGGREVMMEEKEESGGEKVLMIFSLLLSQFLPSKGRKFLVFWWVSAGAVSLASPGPARTRIGCCP